jgi:hypothetical protein
MSICSVPKPRTKWQASPRRTAGAGSRAPWTISRVGCRTSNRAQPSVASWILFQRFSRRGAGLPFALLAARHIARDGCDPTCRRRSTIRFRNRTPVAPRAQNIHDPVRHFAHIDATLVAAALGWPDQRTGIRPFIIGQVTGVSQFAAVRTACSSLPSTSGTSSNRVTPLESQMIQKDSRWLRTDN